VGFAGAPLAMTIVEAMQGIVLFIAAPWLLKGHAASWPDWQDWQQAVVGWPEIIAQGGPCAVMIISEWGGWESALFLAGPVCAGADSCPKVEAIPICTLLMVLEFILCFGPGSAACVRIGNLLGAGQGEDARVCAQVALLMAASVGLLFASAAHHLRHEIAMLFVEDDAVLDEIVQLMPYTIAYSFLATLGPGWSQQVLIGIGGSLRVPAAINFISFAVVGLPLGTVLAYKLDMQVHGLWLGLVIAMCCIDAGHVVYGCLTVDWDEAARQAVQKALEQGTVAVQLDVEEVKPVAYTTLESTARTPRSE